MLDRIEADVAVARGFALAQIAQPAVVARLIAVAPARRRPALGMPAGSRTGEMLRQRGLLRQQAAQRQHDQISLHVDILSCLLTALPSPLKAAKRKPGKASDADQRRSDPFSGSGGFGQRHENTAYFPLETASAPAICSSLSASICADVNGDVTIVNDCIATWRLNICKKQGVPACAAPR
ncbi:hypothetical protein [Chromobacterium vaccinii]|uniref:hypothetical protein n=1 Tax=Chromobacterium vaccinii TaxID=1108595 RepID=UPI001184A5D6|nr:hypothetical protein [Chromobacterium vaccinii]